MLSAYFLTFGAMAASAFAAPTLPTRTTYVANFTLGNVTDDGFAGTPPNLPGVYDGLYYSVFEAYEGPEPDIPDSGIIPHSYALSATWGAYPVEPFGSLPNTPSTASISVNYAKSKALAFDLSSFWFGCTAREYLYNGPTHGLVPVSQPSNCSVTVKGYRATLKALPGPLELPDAVTTFSYVPQSTPNEAYTLLYTAPMQQAKLPPTFFGLKTVTFTVFNKTAPAGANATLAGYIDDVKYTVLSL